MHPHSGPFSIPAINSYIPEKLKPWLIIFFVIIFQFSGGIYFATLNQMVGGTSLLQEDITMAGYASLVGTALMFAIMLRLKMRFTSKYIFLFCSFALIVANLICMYTQNVFVLVATCFLAGIIRMWATFECNSTIQLWLTPTRDLSVFFCYIQLLVQGSIVLSGSTHLYVAFFSQWQFIHWFIIGALLLVMLLTVLTFNSNRFMRPFPLFGIDWLGGFMWGLTLLSINFIFVYGEHYDWWYAEEIQFATLAVIVLLGLNLYRASFIRHPFISLEAFKYKATYLPVFLYVFVDILLSPSHLIEHIYLESILQYDSWHIIYTNLMSFAGIVAGAIFTYFYFAKGKHSYKSTFMIGFGAIVSHLADMYFQIDYHISQSTLFVPLFLRNFGYVVVAAVLLTYLTRVPFHHFFQALTVQAFISAACGSALGGAFIHHLFSRTITENFQLLSANFDHVNMRLMEISPSLLAGLIQPHALLVTFKEIYGVLLWIGLGCLAVFLFYKYPRLSSSKVND